MSMTEYAKKKTTDTEYIATVRENLRALVEALDDMQDCSRGFDRACRSHGLNPMRARQACQRSCVANMKSELYELEQGDNYEADGYERLYADVFNLTPTQLADFKLPSDYQDTVENIFSRECSEGKLSDQKCVIACEYYGLGIYNLKSVAELAKECGVSRERIYQILRYVWRVLRKPENIERLKVGTRQYCKDQELKAEIAKVEQEEYERVRAEKAQQQIEEAKERARQRAEEDAKNAPASETDISQLNLSNRARNALTRSGIKTVEELLKMSDKDLRRIRCIGSGTVANIRKALSELNYRPG